jgi:hypothetical protein
MCDVIDWDNQDILILRNSLRSTLRTTREWLQNVDTDMLYCITCHPICAATIIGNDDRSHAPFDLSVGIIIKTNETDRGG